MSKIPDSDLLREWRAERGPVHAQWETDTVDEKYPDEDTDRRNQEIADQDEPDWFLERYSIPVPQLGDRVRIQVRPECPIHGEMKTIPGDDFYTKLQGVEGKVALNLPGDTQKPPYKEGHTIRVMVDQPVKVRHYGREVLFMGGLFMPIELEIIQEKPHAEEE